MSCLTYINNGICIYFLYVSSSVDSALATEMDQNDILDTSVLTFAGDFDAQLTEVMQHIRLTRQEVEDLQELFDDLADALVQVWKGCKVWAFGSIVTGLGIRTSDVDCYIELPPWLSPPENSFVIKAKNVLMKRPWIFQQLFAIPNAKVPIVKFYHTPTDKCCDVSFKSPSGVENSKLIQHLLQMDERLLILAVLLKYWSKVHNLTGTNLMPNYSLTMLVIFYLQQKSILPPVIHLQENVHELLIDNWNTAFNRTNFNNDNHDSIYELLGDFFQYYSGFEYEKYIISPFVGRPVERKLFENLETVPPEFSLYKNNIRRGLSKPIRLDSFMCVQDPFEHSRNCTVAVYVKLAQKILLNFEKALNIYENIEKEAFLKTLLYKEIVEEPVPKRKRPRKPPLLQGVTKPYRHNVNMRNLKHNVRNHRPHYFRGRARRNWR